MQIISKIALITINETLFVQLISFLIFLFIINRIMFRPLKETTAERGGYLDTLSQDIRNTEKETKDLRKMLKSREDTAREQAIKVQTALEEEGNRQAVRIHADFEKEVAELKRKTLEDIDVQVAEARKVLGAESEAVAVSIMEKILDRRIAV